VPAFSRVRPQRFEINVLRTIGTVDAPQSALAAALAGIFWSDRRDCSNDRKSWTGFHEESLGKAGQQDRTNGWPAQSRNGYAASAAGASLSPATGTTRRP
jgi:hypothetical protein